MDQEVECHQLGKFDPLQWPQDCKAIFQPREAGHISPRKLVMAQQKLAQKNNCTILDDAIVTKGVCIRTIFFQFIIFLSHMAYFH